jgi:hypothetical protein
VQSIAEPGLRFPAVLAALTAEQNPLALLPSKRLEALREFFRNEIAGSDKRIKLLEAILRSPQYLTPPILRVLFSEIRHDKQLLAYAIRHPNFRTLPGARDLYLAQIRDAIPAVARDAMKIVAENWPDDFAGFKDEFARQLTNRNRNVRAASARMLGNVNWSEAEEKLRDLLQDPERIVRHAALTSLVRTIGRRATPELLLMLKDSAPLVRVEACIQIANLKEHAMLDALLERTADVSFRVRLAAFVAVATLDRGLALRNLTRFSRNGRATAFLENINATSEEYSQFDGDRELGSDGDFTRIRDFIDLVQQVIDYEGLCDFRTFSCLRHLMIGRLLATKRSNECVELVEQENVELEKLGISVPSEFIRWASANKLTGQKLDLSQICSQLFLYIQGSSRMALTAQALLIGILKGFDGVTHELPTELKTFRGQDNIDGAFTLITNFFWRISNSSDWGRLKEELQWEEEVGWLEVHPDTQLSEMLLDNLQQWSSFRATPRCLGFLLATGGLKLWRQIPGDGLSSRSLTVLDLYGKSRSATKIFETIFRRVWRGKLLDTSSEVELLAGAGSQQMEKVCDHGQRGLFFKN